jgi:thiol peroxidase
MSRTTNFKGSPLELDGQELKVGDSAPAFTVTGQDMSDIKSDSFSGKVLVLSVVPSIDTPVCSIETKRFNSDFQNLAAEAVCLTVSMDLPFAQKRWCAAEGVEKVIVASDYKHRSLGKSSGAWIKDWGLFSRAVFVIDKNAKIIHAQYVDEVSAEPDYSAVLSAVENALK